MAWLKLVPWQKILACTLVFVMASFLSFPFIPVAQAGIWDDLVSLFIPPDDAPPAGRNSGGAGRGPICALPDGALDNQAGKTVVALVPVKQMDSEDNSLGEDSFTEARSTKTAPNSLSTLGVVGGFTSEERPTFWFYLPYISTPEPPQNRVAQFVLLDDANHPVWNQLMAVELSDRPQLVEYPLSYSLETDKLYTWYFSVICDSEKLSRNPVVRGWIQRAEPTPELQDALRNAPPFEKYLAYANNGIWFDTVSSLVKFRRKFPSTNRGVWSSLLDYFQIPRVNQFDVLEPVEPIELEVVNGNQLPARM
jgi:hypothetical protein